MSEFFHFDGVGSTTELTNESQKVVESYRYEALGEREKLTTNGYAPPFAYVGELGYFRDDTTDDYYVRARQYSPRLSLWLSMDLFGFPEHLYLYARANPINRVDPSGDLSVVRQSCHVLFMHLRTRRCGA